MTCCGPNRRRLLAALAAAAAAPILTRTGSARAQARSLIATDLELVTVTDTSAVFTWTTLAPDATGAAVPAPAGTEIRVAPADSGTPPRPVAVGEDRTPYHYAQVDGLEPGRRYRFEAWSDGTRAAPAAALVTHSPGAPECTGEFETLVPPPGRLLRTFALCNDVHLGEEVSGVIAAGLPPAVRQEHGLPPYPEVMLTALLDDLRRPDRAADHLILAGDLTAEATPEQVRGVRRHLDGWGTPGQDWFAVRGNHDRPHVGADYADCAPVAADHHDCWGESFHPPGQISEHRLGGLRLVGLDTTELDGSGGSIAADQFDRLRASFRADPDRPTVVFGHHPVTAESGLTTIAGPNFVLNRTDALALQQLYRATPGVFFHHAGHTHRNRRTRPDLALRVEFLEVGAVKEYPGGYTLLRLYEGGYMVNFYKTRTPGARRWSTRSRAEYLGLLPDYTLGGIADRNHVVLGDLSGLS